MHIAVPTTSYPRHAGDPAGTFVRALCRELVRRGHTCEVLAPHDAAAVSLGDAGITVTHVPSRALGLPSAFYGAGVPDNVRRDPRAALSAAAFVPSLTAVMAGGRDRWDAVLSHWALPSALAARGAVGGLRHVAVWHSADVQLAQRAFGARAWSLWRHLADEHVFVAEHLRARLGATERAHVLPMGIDVATPVARDMSHALRALVLARLVPIKRVELAIDACAEAGVSLVVAGDGPERARLEARARTHHHADIRFAGAVGPEHRRALFEAADVLLATSAHSSRGATEGYPVAPREALAHGVVVVATEDPVHAELARRAAPSVVLTHERGLAMQLRVLARDRDRLASLARSAPQAVAEDAWPRIAVRFEALLQSSTRRASARGVSASVATSRRAG